MSLPTQYVPSETRYDSMLYRKCGHSGVRLPAISLGLWKNFGGEDVYETGRSILRGRVLATDFKPFRDELIISSKAGWDMWPGPYGGIGSSKKYLIASCDQSLKRMGLDYVDIFYSHRVDPDTPLEETMGALTQIHRQGKALYVGISSYSPELTRKAAEKPRNILRAFQRVRAQPEAPLSVKNG